MVWAWCSSCVISGNNFFQSHMACPATASLLEIPCKQILRVFVQCLIFCCAICLLGSSATCTALLNPQDRAVVHVHWLHGFKMLYCLLGVGISSEGLRAGCWYGRPTSLQLGWVSLMSSDGHICMPTCPISVIFRVFTIIFYPSWVCHTNCFHWNSLPCQWIQQHWFPTWILQYNSCKCVVHTRVSRHARCSMYKFAKTTGGIDLHDIDMMTLNEMGLQCNPKIFSLLVFTLNTIADVGFAPCLGCFGVKLDFDVMHD